MTDLPSTGEACGAVSAVFAVLAGLTLFLLVGLGMLVGNPKVKGIALGAAAVLFTGIAVAAATTATGVTIRVDRTAQHEAIACHATQATPDSVLWRRLELQGSTETLRRLHDPAAPEETT